MAKTTTQDKTFTLVIITDDAGADISETVTYDNPQKIMEVQVQKPASGTLSIKIAKGGGGPETVLGSCSLAATDQEYFNNDQNVSLSSANDSLIVTSTGTGAGTKIAIVSQCQLNTAGRSF